MKLKISVLATAFALSVTGMAQAEDLRIATEGAYPPFNEKNAAGELIGFDVDIANALCAEIKQSCVIVAQDWDGIIPGLVNTKYAAILASMSITEERLAIDRFHLPVLFALHRPDRQGRFRVHDGRRFEQGHRRPTLDRCIRMGRTRGRRARRREAL